MSDVHRETSRFPSRRQGLVLFVVGVVLIALAGVGFFVLVFSGLSHRVTSESYNYFLFVRIQTPGPRAEIWVPVPDFPELRDRVFIRENWTPFPEFPSRNVSQSITSSAYGTMYRFVFSESFGLYGLSNWSAPGSSTGTLTFNSQISNRTWIYLANVSSDNRVSIIMYYERVQALSSGCGRNIFLGTVGPPKYDKGGLMTGAGYLGDIVHDETAYTSISDGWGLYRLVDGAFATCGTGN